MLSTLLDDEYFSYKLLYTDDAFLLAESGG